MIEPSRQRRKALTDKMVAALPRRRKRYIQADPELRGHYVRVPPQGPCVFAAVARYDGKQVWATLGTADVLDDRRRQRAGARGHQAHQGRAAAFEPPPVQPDTVADVCAGWLKRHVEAKGLRTGDEMRRILERTCCRSGVTVPSPRSDAATLPPLLDAVEDGSGAWVS